MTGAPRALRLQGQGTVEYLLLLVGIILAILYAVRPSGPIQSAVDRALTDTETVVTNTVNQVRQKLGL